MKKMFVIGAGYVGGELVRQAQESGWQVVAGTRSGEGDTTAVDVSSEESLCALRAELGCPDVIVHCASSGRGGVDAYRAVFEVGVERLAHVFPEVPLVFVSSSSVYAQVNGESVTEESEAAPTRETGIILRTAEESVVQRGGVVARLSGIYGPARSVLLKKLLKDEAEIEEDGRRIINQIHQYDAASALLFLAERTATLGGEIFNVTDSHPRSQKETYVGLCDLLQRELPPVGVRDLNRKRGWTHKAVSNAKLVSAGWEPRYPNFLEAASGIIPTLIL